MKTIVKTIAGSHLFGLNTPKSDLDYKGVFQESLPNIILGKDSKNVTITTNKTSNRNTQDDVDTELKELRTFIKDCIKGQTYAVEMLFCPEDKIIESSLTWKLIQENRDKLIPNDLSPFVGYASGQSQKYSLRGIRLEEAQRVYVWLCEQNPNSRLFEVIETLTTTDYTYRDTFTHKDGRIERRLHCVGLDFQEDKLIREIKPSLEKRINQYGERSKLNKDNGGVDWKAYSHAFRLLYEWEQLLTERQLTFPVPNREYILSVKQGDKPFDEVQDKLFEEFDRIKKIENNLPKPDIKFWEDFMLNQYL